MNVCTIVAGRHVPYARVLARSLRQHNPEASLTALIIDDQASVLNPSEEPFAILHLDVLEVPQIQALRAAFDYEQLIAVLKPYFLRFLLSNGSSSHVIYFGYECAIYDSVTVLYELLDEHDAVIASAITALCDLERSPSAYTGAVEDGAFCRDFIALRAGSHSADFLKFWVDVFSDQDVIEIKSAEALEIGFFDSTPSLLPNSYILRDSSFVVSFANPAIRTLSRKRGRYTIDGEPLRAFLFKGYDPERPHLLNGHQGTDPRIPVIKSRSLSRLCSSYGKELTNAGYRDWSRLPSSFDTLPNGCPFTKEMRALYRNAVEDRVNLGDVYSREGQDRFLSWLNEPVDGGVRYGLTRFLFHLYRNRVDLQWWLPELNGDAVASLVEWADVYGRHEVPIPDILIPRLSTGHWRACGDKEGSGLVQLPGLNVVGFLKGELGQGEAARQLSTALARKGLKLAQIGQPAADHRNDHEFHNDTIHETATFPITMYCLNGDSLLQFREQVGDEFFTSRCNIGVWWWEAAAFPQTWEPAFELLDEIWVGSAYVANTISEVSPIPVVKIPMPVHVRLAERTDRSTYGLPDDFMFLFSFDFHSTVERKNPVGAIEAFKNAFEPGEGPMLVVKSIGGDQYPSSLREIRDAAANRPDIHIIDRYLSPEEKAGLFATCDCYVSLHRAEGFGYTLADAMYLGKPAIATGYSGNLEFMNPMNSYLVHHGLTEIPRSAGPYPAGPEWADPELSHASELMRYVYNNREEAQRKGERAARDIRRRHSLDAAGAHMIRRLQLLWCRYQTKLLSDLKAKAPAIDGNLPNNVNDLGSRVQSGCPERSGRSNIAKNAARKTLLRAMRPYATFQREVDLSLVDNIRELMQEVARNRADLDALRRRISQMDASNLDAFAVLRFMNSKRGNTEERDEGVVSPSAENMGELLGHHDARPDGRLDD